MAKSTRRPQQVYTFVMWLLSITFAGFLIGLGSLIIKDLPKIDTSITLEQFVDKEQTRNIDSALDPLAQSKSDMSRSLEDRTSERDSARTRYLNARASFDNWIKTRTATQASDQNTEVINRTRQIETLKDLEGTAQQQVQGAQNELRQLSRQESDLRKQRDELLRAARPEYNKALNAQSLRVFLMRLAITLPLLILAGWVAAKKRDSAYWPLYRGFVLFALFAFFVELVPYLPSYGGYVRYIVGLMMIVVFGHFIIRSMRRYLERKQVEESRSESERRGSIEYETALKKISAKTCPGCDRSIIQRDDVETDFCVHCGIRLKQKCGNCGERNISFHRFCLSCGCETEAGLKDTSAANPLTP